MNPPLTLPLVPRPARPATPAPTKSLRLRWNFAEWFVLSQTFLPALLYLPGTQPFRVVIRTAAYGISLGALVYCWVILPSRDWRTRLSSSASWLLGALAYLAVMLAHPATNSLAAGLGQIGLSLAIMAPAFWAPALVESPERLRRLLWLLLLCSGINAFVGVMQVRNPDFWMPKEFSSVMTESEIGLGNVIYEGANGQMIIRPPGLLDAPGAVAGPATFALFLGLVFAAEARRRWTKAFSFAFAALGAAAIFFTMVRSCLIIAVGMMFIYLGMQLGQRRFGMAINLLIATLAALTLAFLYAAAVGGENLTSRFQSIIAENPADFYFENRGNQVAAGFDELLPKYPFGAGLGRYGMMNAYFGNPQNPASPPIYVEIQVPGWIVDGGIIMLILYPVALLITLGEQFVMASRHPDVRIRSLAGMIFASNLALVFLCSSYAVFLSPLGIQFWFFSGALYSLGRAKRSPRAVGKVPRPPSKPAVPLLYPANG